MVAFLPWIISSVVVLFVGVQVFKPRLPAYTFKVAKIAPKLCDGFQFKAQLGSKVKLTNDNFVHIDIHSLSFDLFYPDWYGDYNHIGNVHDTNKNNKKSETSESNDAAPVALATSSSSESSENEDISSPLWALLPREVFETHDDVLLSPSGNFRTLTTLGKHALQNRGVLMVPSTGVIFIKANKKIPLTMSIVCNNMLNLWDMEMQGKTCQLHDMAFGWTPDIDVTIEEIRTQVIEFSQPVKKSFFSSILAKDNDTDDDASKRNNPNTRNLASDFEEKYERIVLEQEKEQRKAKKKKVFPFVG